MKAVMILLASFIYFFPYEIYPIESIDSVPSFPIDLKHRGERALCPIPSSKDGDDSSPRSTSNGTIKRNLGGGWGTFSITAPLGMVSWWELSGAGGNTVLVNPLVTAAICSTAITSTQIFGDSSGERSTSLVCILLSGM